MSNKIIPYGRHDITEDDIEAVTKILRSDFLTQGPSIQEFEEKFANYVGSKYAVAVSNGTAALHLTALALDVDNNTNVITTSITFAASANCIRYCGGNIWFTDIDPKTYCLDISKVEELILSKPDGFFHGIIPVDFAGYPIDLEKYRNLAEKYNLWLIEDACHAPGGFFIDSNQKRQYCGNGRFADMSIFSFHPVKHIATGEGGMVTTNDINLYKKLLLFRTHGITKTPESFKNTLNFAIGNEFNSEESIWPNWYMEMQILGYNYRLTDFQAALGISQLKRAEKGIERRREIAKIYNQAFENKPWLISQSGDVAGHAYHLYIINVEKRLGLYNTLKENNIYTQIHYIPVHCMPYYKGIGWKEGDLPKAENYYNHCLSLPMFPSITNEEVDFVIMKIKNFYDASA
jgi:UDP-4-amino-4,6-dideoxy-N-acetyl-beta-L-altrosamine transaminase